MADHIQLHAGRSAINGSDIWHTDTDGNYWSGNLYHRTPEQLLLECLTIIADLFKNHPELYKADSTG